MPTIDVTAGAMLIELGKELHAEGKRLVLAREIGQAREEFDHTDAGSAPPDIENRPTVRAAVAALRED